MIQPFHQCILPALEIGALAAALDDHALGAGRGVHNHRRLQLGLREGDELFALCGAEQVFDQHDVGAALPHGNLDGPVGQYNGIAGWDAAAFVAIGFAGSCGCRSGRGFRILAGHCRYPRSRGRGIEPCLSHGRDHVRHLAAALQVGGDPFAPDRRNILGHHGVTRLSG
jgi:hypothetical protein